MIHGLVFRCLPLAIICLAGGCAPGGSSGEAPPKLDRLPNVIIIFTDDQGYADVGSFGAEGFETPNLDRMAAEGMRFTDFYVGQAVCGASRAALLTGCYPNRIGLLGAPSHATNHGIHDDEMTIAELLKQEDYATAMYGKWHLGHHEKFLPLQHGFDDYLGLPYSNDMWPYHPTNKSFPDLPLIEGNQVVHPKMTPDDQKQLTTRYTNRAVKFIEKNHEWPFFLYVAHAMPHVPLFVSEKYNGKSEQALYGDVMMEIDWSVGRILAALKEHDIDDDTLVIFTSDNGPWLSYGHHAGSAEPLREGKGTTWEGGMRVPCIMRWPTKIPADSECREVASTIDILPTLSFLTGAPLSGNKIDGKNIWPLMSGKAAAKSPHEAFYYYWGNDLQAVRGGQWKLHFPHEYRSLKGEPGRDGLPGEYEHPECELELYDLHADIGETTNVAAKHPDVVQRLQAFANKARQDLGDEVTYKKGRFVREHGLLYD